MPKVLTELAVFHPDSILLAAELGVPRIELCSDYSCGGLSPSASEFRFARAHYKGQLFVMVRPRPGDFTYSRQDYTKMCELARFFIEEGADGLVAGFLDSQQRIDEAQLQEFISIASPLPFTFHRAFDLIEHKKSALETLIRLGCTRVLSSGRAPTALQGAEELYSMQQQAAGRIIILPGGGIRASNLQALLSVLPVSEVHTAALATNTSQEAIASRQELQRILNF